MVFTNSYNIKVVNSRLVGGVDFISEGILLHRIKYNVNANGVMDEAIIRL